jgi:hypothetical protein
VTFSRKCWYALGLRTLRVIGPLSGQLERFGPHATHWDEISASGATNFFVISLKLFGTIFHVFEPKMPFPEPKAGKSGNFRKFPGVDPERYRSELPEDSIISQPVGNALN